MDASVTNREKTKAIIITVGIHIVVILLFLLIKYTIPAQQHTEDYGMEVNLGNSEDGFGTDQPEDPNPPSAADGASGMTLVNSESDDTKDVYTDDEADDDRPEVYKPKQKPTNTTAQINKQEKQKNNKQLTTPQNSPNNNASTQRTSRFGVQDALNASGNAASNTKAGGSQGDGTGAGDKGVPGGDPNATNYVGRGGSGTSSFNHSFSNRHVVSPPSKVAEFGRGGTVNVNVRVDREGRVTVTGISGTTDPTLNALARQKAASIRFNKAGPNDPIEQKGTIVFNFKVGK